MSKVLIAEECGPYQCRANDLATQRDAFKSEAAALRLELDQAKADLAAAREEIARLKRDVVIKGDFAEAKHTYTMYQDEEGDFVVAAQGKLGCKAHGETPNQAMLVMIEVEKLWEEAVAAGDVPYPTVQTCEICGRPERIAWSIDDATFEQVMGGKDGHTPCLYCFADRAEKVMGRPMIFEVTTGEEIARRAEDTERMIEADRQYLAGMQQGYIFGLAGEGDKYAAACVSRSEQIRAARAGGKQ